MRCRWALVAGAVGLLAACGGDDTGAEVTTTVATPPTAPDTVAAPEAEDSEPAPDESPAPEPDVTEPETPVADEVGFGRATIEVDGVPSEFVVLQCLRDITSVTGTAYEFQLAAVAAATPPDVVESVLDRLVPGAGPLGALEPAFAFGPGLTIERMDGGGDLVLVADLVDVNVSSAPNPFDPDSRLLEISPGDTGATVSGSIPSLDGGTMEVEATCP